MMKKAFASYSSSHRPHVALFSCVAGPSWIPSKTIPATSTQLLRGLSPEGPIAVYQSARISNFGNRHFSSLDDSTINGASSPPSSSSSAARDAANPRPSDSLDGYYHIEASNVGDFDEDNAVPIHATKLTVTGPDVDGILASMTVALAVRGCSLVSLHAAKFEDMGVRTDVVEDPATTPIRDVFYVVDRNTGRPFLDSELYDLAVSLLEALRKPMAIMGANALGTSFGTTGSNTIAAVLAKTPIPPYATHEEQITILRSSDGTD